MKAITTGFAVTALAAAISGQAMAAEATYEFSGEINVESTFDFEADTRDMTIADETDGDQDAFELFITTTVTNGPFSGSLYIEEVEDAIGAGPATGAVDVYIDDLTVTEGKFSFGQLGDIVATDKLLETASDDDDADDLSYSVLGGFRYTDADAGLTVQAEANSVAGNEFGFGASYTTDIGMGSVTADVQYAEDGAGTALDTFVGVGAELMPTEELTVTFAYQTKVDSQYAVRADYATDAMSVYASYYEPSADNAIDDEVITVGGSMSMGMLTPYAEYGMTTLADAGDYIEAGVKYSNDAIGGKAEVTINNFDAATADEAIIELDVNYTSESGVVYAAEYTSQSGISNNVVLSAAYSF